MKKLFSLLMLVGALSFLFGFTVKASQTANTSEAKQALAIPAVTSVDNATNTVSQEALIPISEIIAKAAADKNIKIAGTIVKIENEEGIWEVTALLNGIETDFVYDPSTSTFTKAGIDKEDDMIPSQGSVEIVLKTLQATGFKKITSIKADDGGWKADADGKEIKFDMTGTKILGQEVDD